MNIVIIGAGYVGLTTTSCLTWQEFIQADWEAIKRKMKQPCLVFDGCNALPQDKLRALGFNYIGVGQKI